jgi:hypothetical protein
MMGGTVMTEDVSASPPADDAGGGPTTAVVPSLLTPLGLMTLTGLRPGEVAAFIAAVTVVVPVRMSDMPVLLINRRVQ